MASNTLQLHNDLWLLAEEIQERLDNARTSTKALLILKEHALVSAACGDALDAFQHIAGEAMQAASLIDIILRRLNRAERPILARAVQHDA